MRPAISVSSATTRSRLWKKTKSIWSLSVTASWVMAWTWVEQPASSSQQIWAADAVQTEISVWFLLPERGGKTLDRSADHVSSLNWLCDVHRKTDRTRLKEKKRVHRKQSGFYKLAFSSENIWKGLTLQFIKSLNLFLFILVEKTAESFA